LGLKNGQMERFLSPMKLLDDPRTKRLRSAYKRYARPGIPIVEFHGFSNEAQTSNSYGSGNLEWVRDVTAFCTDTQWTTSTQAPWEQITLTMKMPLDMWQTILPGKPNLWPNSKKTTKDGSASKSGLRSEFNPSAVELHNRFLKPGSRFHISPDDGAPSNAVPRRSPEPGFYIVLRVPNDKTEGIPEYADGFPAIAWAYVTNVTVNLKTGQQNGGSSNPDTPVAVATIQATSWAWVCEQSRLVFVPGKNGWKHNGFSFDLSTWKDIMGALIKWAGEGQYPGAILERIWNGGRPLHAKSGAPHERGDGLCTIMLPNTVASKQGHIYKGSHATGLDPKELDKLSGEKQKEVVERGLTKGTAGGTDFDQKFVVNLKPYRYSDSIPIVWNIETCSYYAPNRLPQMLRVPGRALNAFSNILPQGTIWQWLSSTFAADNRVVEFFPSLETPLPFKNPYYSFITEGQLSLGESQLGGIYGSGSKWNPLGNPSGLVTGDMLTNISEADKRTLGIDSKYNGDADAPIDQGSPLDTGTGRAKFSENEWRHHLNASIWKYKMLQNAQEYGLYSPEDQEAWEEHASSLFDKDLESIKVFGPKSKGGGARSSYKCWEDIVAPSRHLMSEFAKGLGAQPVLIYRMRPKFFIPSLRDEWSKWLREREKHNANITPDLRVKISTTTTAGEFLQEMGGNFTDYGLRTVNPWSLADFSTVKYDTKGNFSVFGRSEVISVSLNWNDAERVNAVYARTPIQPASQMHMFGYFGSPATDNRCIPMHGLRLYEVDWPYWPVHTGQSGGPGMALNMQLTALIDVAWQMICKSQAMIYHASATVVTKYRPYLKAGHWVEVGLPQAQTWLTHGGMAKDSLRPDIADTNLGEEYDTGHTNTEACTGYAQTVIHKVSVDPQTGAIRSTTTLKLIDVALSGRSMFQVGVAVRGLFQADRPFMMIDGQMVFGKFDKEKEVFVSTDSLGNTKTYNLDGTEVTPGSSALGGGGP